MGVADKQRTIFQNNQRQRTVGLLVFLPKHLIDIVQVPPVLAKSAANQAVGVLPVDHDRRDCGAIGAHDRFRKIWCDAVARHNLVIGAPVVTVAGIVLWVDDAKVAVWSDIESEPFAALQNDLGAAN